MRFVSCCEKFRPWIHIETATLADGTYELVPMHEDESAGAQVNALELIQDPNQSSEEPKANCCLGRQAPVYLIHIIFNLCNLCCTII